ncbi:MAG: hypothetical protein COW65_18410 [Cytophagales bacterium CG18_big_fil_WC_8_21_14_2_50_42_9]|nr:MAG: hypothetical protein COW65_18410 [Cytophagales bacterium CG18_big_fil_WC_8_21_14_2_50_42_9]
MANSAQYSNISPQTFNSLKSKLAGFGINMAGSSGRISEKGVSAEYAYDETAQTLAIRNVSVGFPASMMYNSDKIISTITGEVQNAGGQLA